MFTTFVSCARNRNGANERSQHRESLLRECIMTHSPSQSIGNVRTRDERAPRATLEFVLPDLDAPMDGAIESENLHAVGALYFACLLEEMRLFQVVERIVELFRQGLLPLGPGPARDFLSDYDRWSADRISDSERRDLYARVFGVPGGTPDGERNRDFERLWTRFLCAISTLVRQVEEARQLEAALSMLQEAVRNAGNDLAANLSQHGFGIAYFAATEVVQAIVEIRDLLRDAELRAAFGARDMWQVIDRINIDYLGGARNTNRYRTRSKAGAVIIRWIGNNGSRLAGAFGDLFEVEQLSRAKPQSVPHGHNPTVDPTDRDLIDSAEQWLAAGDADEDDEGADTVSGKHVV